jgi:hypothetical protein
MRHVLLIALTALCVGAAFAGSASAAHTTACSMVTAAEYKKVLGHPVRIRPGEGSSSCNVLVGGSFAHDIIPNLNPYNAAYVKRMLSTMTGKQRVASLGPVGYVVVGTDGSVTSYAEKHGWFIAFQGLKKGNMNKAQAIKLARIALTRL